MLKENIAKLQFEVSAKWEEGKVEDAVPDKVMSNLMRNAVEKLDNIKIGDQTDDKIEDADA